MLAVLFCVARQYFYRSGRLTVKVSRSHTHTHTHTHTHIYSIELLWTSDQSVTEAGTYTTHNKHTRRASRLANGFEQHAIPEITRPQTCALHRTATGIGLAVRYQVQITEKWNIGRRLLIRIEVNILIGRGTPWRSCLRHRATSWKVAGSIPEGVMGSFHWHNPSGLTMVLGLTQPLTEMSTSNISWRVKAAGV
jgi:hypothetical protein